MTLASMLTAEDGEHTLVASSRLALSNYAGIMQNSCNFSRMYTYLGQSAQNAICDTLQAFASQVCM